MCCSLFLNGAGLYCLLFKQIKSTKKDTKAYPGGRLNCLRYVPLPLPSGRVLDADQWDRSVWERDFAGSTSTECS